MKEKLSYQELENELEKLKTQITILNKENEILKKDKKIQDHINLPHGFHHEKPSEQYLLEILMNTIPDRIYFKDAKSQFIKISKSLAKKHGIDNPEDAIGKTDFDFFTKEHAEQAFHDEQNILAHGMPLKNIEEKETWNDGSITWASTTKMPIIDKNNRIVGTFGISRDITNQKKIQQSVEESEKKLRDLNAAKDKFFSIIAHDLMSPVCTMVGFSQLLNKNIDNYSIEKTKEIATIINKSVESTYNLLENLLLWARNQRGFNDFKPKMENLFKLSMETIELLTPTAKNKSITLINNIQDTIFINADKNMVLTIFRNLLSNAIKFTSKEGEIIIDARLIKGINNQNSVEVSVKDSGVGISKERQNQLFKLIENSSTKGTENESGTGLGLLICKDFVEKHGGKIWVESDPGKGSKFIFILPT